MPLTANKIKFELIERAGTLRNAARLLSQDDYVVSESHLAKVVRGERSTRRLQALIAQYIGKSVNKVFGNAPQSNTKKNAVKN